MLQPVTLAMPILSRLQASAASSQDPSSDPLDQVLRSNTDRPMCRLDPERAAEEQCKLAGRVACAGLPPLFASAGLLFPDSHGKIKHMAFQFGNVEFDRPLPEETRKAVLGMYGQLMRNMAPDSRFTIVCADQRGVDSIHQLVQETGTDPARVTVVAAEAVQGFSIWIRDSMLPVRMPDGRTLLMIQDRTYWPGPEDARVPALIDQAHGSLESSPHPALRIDGGNVVSNRHQVIVGSDSVEHTRARLQELAQDPDRLEDIRHFYEAWTGQEVNTADESSLARMWQDVPVLVFEKAFQKDVLIVGGDDPGTPIREQPAFHIDMCVTPIGENKMLVGSPALAITELLKLSPEERASANQAMAHQAGLDPRSDLIGELISTNSGAHCQANYDRVARQLEAEGYEVERIPSMVGLRTTWSLPYLTYNNCMMEAYPGQDGEMVRKVYLPTYGCEPLDCIAIKAYQRNGFEVVPLEMAAISKLEGAIRCSTYAVERDLGNPNAVVSVLGSAP
ncbi:hypothetical protein DYH09_10045 [bacterium CPR1]|nr:hypothetical protein [bacterium CPR1]